MDSIRVPPWTKINRHGRLSAGTSAAGISLSLPEGGNPVEKKKTEEVRSAKEIFASTLSIVLFSPWRPTKRDEKENQENDRVWSPKGRPPREAAVPNPILWYSSRPKIIKRNQNDDSNLR
jgi:hypothetical protein